MHYTPSTIPAKNVRPGMALLNGVNFRIVEDVHPSKTGKTVSITYVEGGKRTKKRYDVEATLFIDDEIINVIIFDRESKRAGATQCDDCCARENYEYYLQYLGTEYTRVTWERSTNGGHTWDMIARKEV